MATAADEAANSTNRTTYEEAHSAAAAYLHSRLAVKDEALDKAFTVPLIDLATSFSPVLADRQTIAEQIRKACTTSGFFYIANHGAPDGARDGILEQAKRFHDELSLEQKEQLHIKKSKLGLGWDPSEYTSIAGDQERKEGFNLSYEAALDPTGGDGLYRNLDGSDDRANLWPKEEDLPGFCAAVKDYYGGVLSLARHHLL